MTSPVRMPARITVRLNTCRTDLSGCSVLLFVNTHGCCRGKAPRTASIAGERGIRRLRPFFVSMNVRAPSATCSQRSAKRSPMRAPVISASRMMARSFRGAPGSAAAARPG